MMSAVSTHWNQVTKSGAGMVAPGDDSNTLFENTSDMETMK